MTAPIIRSLAELRSMVAAWKRAGDVVGVCPTMGALHAGHLSLVQAAKEQCDRAIVTIFVNPKQFNNPGDLANYPRTEHEDAIKLAPFGADVIYVPDNNEMYPPGFATSVSVDGLTDVLCGAHRPGHFDGVATVVCKLFLQTQADRAFFGEKDYQQLQVVRRMVTDLNIPTDVIGCPTIREADGLAMSSRNLRLTTPGRASAVALIREMCAITSGLAKGQPWKNLHDSAVASLTSAGFDQVEYLDLRAGATLQSVTTPTSDSRLFAAAFIDGVRLIDNIGARI